MILRKTLLPLETFSAKLAVDDAIMHEI